MRVVPLEAFRDKVPFAVAIAAVERGFRALGRGEAALPDPMVLELREQQAEVHVKGAHLAGGRHIVLKVATGFYRNRARGLPSGDGMFLLLDADTGVPAVLLEEHGYLTDFRTAAAVALTLKYLAPKDTRDALLVGAGALARLTARAMLAQLPLARLTLWHPTRERADGRGGFWGGPRHAHHVWGNRQPGEDRARASVARAGRQAGGGPRVPDGALQEHEPAHLRRSGHPSHG